MTMNRRATASTIGVVGLMSIALLGCSSAVGSPPSAPSPTPGATASAAPAVTPSVAPLPSAVPSASSAPLASSGPAALPVYQEGDPHPIDPGTYTSDLDDFFPGLTFTIPAGWSATESDDGELSLHPDDRAGDALLLWKDMVAVVTNNRAGTVGQPLAGVDRTEPALVSWLTKTKDFEILAKPKPVTVAGIKGDQLTLTTSATANFAFSDCPDNPRCSALFTDPEHWGPNYFAIGGKEVARIFAATLPYESRQHTFFVVLDSISPEDLTAFATEAQPIIDSLGLPASYVDN
ncbi:MAG TPA: hypothetical protein VKR24_07485 [Candidatus Limnocylindrales bacterium]|nr:hypothetical protein [Candidatus Limnocylindrales bacterium]